MPQPIYIAGPTASGKSALALYLATHLDGEIISVDSMQVYCGLDIGTAKPTAAERASVPHHLLDLADPSERFDVARFLQLAHQAQLEIEARGRTPIFCGGTGLYFKALNSGIGSSPPADETLRRELDNLPSETLLDEIKAKDPILYANIDRSNRRRLLRALEVVRTTGRPFSETRADWTTEQTPGLWIGLERSRPDLYARINSRVDAMFAAGLVDETRELLQRGLESNPTAMQALGYRQVVGFLRGERDLAQTVALVKQKTRHFAKRQMTWFRHQLKLDWFSVGEGEPVATLGERVLAHLSLHHPPPRR